MDELLNSARDGGPIAGALFWNAAHNNSLDADGAQHMHVCARTEINQ